MAIPSMSYSRFRSKLEQTSDPTDKDELDIMARSSPVLVTPADSGRVLRARASMSNTAILKPKKRERRLSESTVENHDGIVGKKRKMEDRKAVCLILSFCEPINDCVSEYHGRKRETSLIGLSKKTLVTQAQRLVLAPAPILHLL